MEAPVSRMSPVDTIRYLEAKRTVDDRALNPRVWATVWRELRTTAPRVLELGCGIGTMIERVLEAQVLRSGQYSAVDLNPSFLDEARRRLHSWSQRQGLLAREGDQELILEGAGRKIRVGFRQGDITQDLSEVVGGDWDLLMANALLDLVDLHSTLPGLLDLLAPGGLAYFTINFDGVTSFLPAFEPDLDRRLMDLYHRTMDERGRQADTAPHSRTGRALLSLLPELGVEILAAGGSDWTVHPQGDSYPAREGEFLASLLDTVEHALRDRPELTADELDRWLETRRQQLDGAKLTLLTHQLDVCGRV